MLSALLTLLVFGFVGIVALSVVLALVGAVFGLAFGLAGFLLFKVAPIVLVGWVVLRLIGRSRPARGDRRLSAADQRWLDS